MYRRKVIVFIRYFTEWIAPDIDIDNAFELANLGRFLTRWLFHWEHILHDRTAKNQIIQELDTWSESILRMSQLLVLIILGFTSPIGDWKLLTHKPC